MSEILSNFVKGDVIELDYTFKSPDCLQEYNEYTFEGDLWKSKTFTYEGEDYVVCITMDQEFKETYNETFWAVEISTNTSNDMYYFSHDDDGYEKAFNFYSYIVESLRSGSSQITPENVLNITI